VRILLRHLGTLVVAIAATGVVVARSHQDDATGAHASSIAGRFEAVLSRAGGPFSADPVTLAQELLALGADAVDRSFDALANEIDRGAETSSSSPRMLVLWKVFDLAGSARWRPVVERRLNAAPTSGAISASITIVRDGGRSPDLALLLRAGQLDSAREHGDDLTEAFTRVLKRDESGFGVIEGAIPVDQPHVWPCVVAGVEGTHSPRAAHVLARWIERHKSIRAACLQYMSRLALSLPKPFPDDVVIGLRAMLERGESDTLPDLLVCMGRLEDDASIPTFLRWLKEGEYSVRQNALWALQITTRLSFREDPKAWATWWRDESSWWDHESASAFASLRRGTKAEKVAALNAIDMRRTGRHRLADEVAPALRDRDEDVACLAANELGNLGSTAAIDELIESLGPARPRLDKAARTALERITKRKLTGDADAIRAAMGRPPGSS